MPLQRVRYTGPVERLQGRTATAYLPEAGQRCVQFDDLSQPEAIGWHYMPAEHFQIVPEKETTHG